MTAQNPLTSTRMSRFFGAQDASTGASGAARALAPPWRPSDKAGAKAQNTPVISSDYIVITVTSLTQKAQNIEKLLGNLERNIATLQVARDAISEVIGNIEEAGGLTIRARDTLKTPAGYEGNKDRLAELEKRYAAAIEKNDVLIKSLSGTGANLLAGDTLVTNFDDLGHSRLETHGYNLTGKGLEFRKPDFSSQFTVQDSRIDVMNGIDIAVTLRHQVTSDMMLIQTRQEFSQNAMASLNAGSEKIELKDLGDEAANLLALQIRQQLSETVEPLASEAQQSLLKQF